MSDPQDTPGGHATVTDAHAGTLRLLGEALGEDGFTTARFRDNLRVYVPRERLLGALRALKERGGFAMLAELGATDYLKYPGRNGSGRRFEVHYVLRNLDTDERLVLKVGVDDAEPSIPSAVPLWEGANWMEREVFDMFGIAFDGHPDPRRILMPDEFAAYPLRKDYPLRGRGERHNFPRLTRENS